MRLINGVIGLVKKTVIGTLAAAGVVFLLFVLDLLFNGADDIEPSEEPVAE